MRSLIQDKRGVGPLVFGLGVLPLIVVGVFLLIVIGIILVFTSINFLAVVGTTVAILSLTFLSRGEFTRTKGIFMLVLVSLGIALVIGGQVSQSVLSVDRIATSVDNGKVFWTVFASASNIDESFEFVRTMDAFEHPDGTTVTPTKRLALTVQEIDSSCRYALIDIAGAKGLATPSKDIDIRVFDANSGQSQTLQGERSDSVTINDPDGQGQLVVSSQGILERESRCPDNENVAIIEEDGETRIVFRDILLQGRQACANKFFSISCLVNLFADVPSNTQFTGSFDSVQITSTEIIGRGLDLGEATFTITADQDYFDSVVFTPAQPCDPEISDIFVADEIVEGSSSSIRVNVENNNDNDCEATVSVSSSDDVSFSPMAKEVTLRDSSSSTFTISNGGEIGSKRISAEVCFVSQFTGEICDTASTSFRSIEKSIISEPKEECGDNICQPFESFTQCPSDCDAPLPGEEELECAFYQEEFTRIDKNYGPFFWRALPIPFVDPITTETPDCKVSSLVWIIAGVIIIITLAIAIILTTPKRKKRGKK